MDERLKKQFDFIKEIDKENSYSVRHCLQAESARKTMPSTHGIWRL